MAPKFLAYNKDIMEFKKHSLKLRHLGIVTYKEAVIYIRSESYIVRSEGFEAQSRIHVSFGNKSIIATLNIIKTNLLEPDEASLSEYAWEELGVKAGDTITVSHPTPLNSMNHIRAKIYNKKLDTHSLDEIIHDVVAGNLSDVQIAAFLSACAGNRLDLEEITLLTKSMLTVGEKIKWPSSLIVDKHCIGGIPGNRTTIIIVPIIAAFGLTIPKTSSRAITSAAGTADTMETMAPVNLTFNQIQKVVAKENGCIVWGDAAAISPADDILIRVERVLNLDSLEQVVASVLSKKIAAGSTHVLIDIPVGPSAKVRTEFDKQLLKKYFEHVSEKLGIKVNIAFTDGTKPIGRGIGPTLEAHDILSILQNKPDAPDDLKEKSLMLAGKILEFSNKVKTNQGRLIAEKILRSGEAWRKFQAICEAQGGMKVPKIAEYTYSYEATKNGKIINIENRLISALAKLAGAPHSKAAGVYLNATIGSFIEKGQPLLTIHAETPGELDYALNFLRMESKIFAIEES